MTDSTTEQTQADETQTEAAEQETAATPPLDPAYSDQLKADLQAEVETRNAGRDEQDFITVAAPGNKAELVAALEADDNVATEPVSYGYDVLVRVRLNSVADTVETNMGRALAESAGVEILAGEPTTTPDGRLRGDTGRDGRPLKPKTTVADAAAAKKAATSAETSKEQGQ